MIPVFNPLLAIGLMVGVVGLLWLTWWLIMRKRRKARMPIVDESVDGTLVSVDGVPTEPAKTKYDAIIISSDNVWDFQGKVDGIMGSVFTPDGTLPEAGKGHYLVLDKDVKKQGKNDSEYLAYDPRDDVIDAALTPEKLYRAVFRWKFCIPYRNPLTWLDKLPTLMAYLMIFATFIFGIIVLGGGTKGG